ncbi:hypothetical protein Pcinc_017078 [Petrolisthes cinctipes]|uniref:PDZ domain-containing protein n=1 Tax=Petrolisthes cinctipes TaxID=88211 RepID=A0AAE1FQV5_PETCI|nr:hypothetical protein Pcinc_017078 [Petrolisthes cinctipes]
MPDSGGVDKEGRVRFANVGYDDDDDDDGRTMTESDTVAGCGGTMENPTQTNGSTPQHGAGTLNGSVPSYPLDPSASTSTTTSSSQTTSSPGKRRPGQFVTVVEVERGDSEKPPGLTCHAWRGTTQQVPRPAPRGFVTVVAVGSSSNTSVALDHSNLPLDQHSLALNPSANLHHTANLTLEHTNLALDQHNFALNHTASFALDHSNNLTFDNHMRLHMDPSQDTEADYVNQEMIDKEKKATDDLQKQKDSLSSVPDQVVVYRLPGERLGLGLKFDGGMGAQECVRRLFIQSVAPDSPAARAAVPWGELQPGDQILNIEGCAVSTLTRVQCVSFLKDAAMKITIGVLKGNGKLPDLDTCTSQGMLKTMKEEDEDEEMSGSSGSPRPPPLIVGEMRKRIPPPPLPPRARPRKSPARPPKDPLPIPPPPSDFQDPEDDVPSYRNLSGIHVPNLDDKDASSHGWRDSFFSRYNRRGDLEELLEDLEFNLPDSWTEKRLHESMNRGLPPRPSFYLDLVGEEDAMGQCESESDETSSSVSTVIDRLSLSSSTTVSRNSSFNAAADNSRFDLARALSPFEQLEKEFEKDTMDECTQTTPATVPRDEVILAPPIDRSTKPPAMETLTTEADKTSPTQKTSKTKNRTSIKSFSFNLKGRPFSWQQGKNTSERVGQADGRTEPFMSLKRPGKRPAPPPPPPPRSIEGGPSHSTSPPSKTTIRSKSEPSVTSPAVSDTSMTNSNNALPVKNHKESDNYIDMLGEEAKVGTVSVPNVDVCARRKRLERQAAIDTSTGLEDLPVLPQSGQSDHSPDYLQILSLTDDEVQEEKIPEEKLCTDTEESKEPTQNIMEGVQDSEGSEDKQPISTTAEAQEDDRRAEEIFTTLKSHSDDANSTQAEDNDAFPSSHTCIETLAEIHHALDNTIDSMESVECDSDQSLTSVHDISVEKVAITGETENLDDTVAKICSVTHDDSEKEISEVSDAADLNEGANIEEPETPSVDERKLSANDAGNECVVDPEVMQYTRGERDKLTSIPEVEQNVRGDDAPTNFTEVNDSRGRDDECKDFGATEEENECVAEDEEIKYATIIEDDDGAKEESKHTGVMEADDGCVGDTKVENSAVEDEVQYSSIAEVKEEDVIGDNSDVMFVDKDDETNCARITQVSDSVENENNIASIEKNYYDDTVVIDGRKTGHEYEEIFGGDSENNNNITSSTEETTHVEDGEENSRQNENENIRLHSHDHPNVVPSKYCTQDTLPCQHTNEAAEEDDPTLYDDVEDPSEETYMGSSTLSDPVSVLSSGGTWNGDETLCEDGDDDFYDDVADEVETRGSDIDFDFDDDDDVEEEMDFVMGNEGTACDENRNLSTSHEADNPTSNAAAVNSTSLGMIEAVNPVITTNSLEVVESGNSKTTTNTTTTNSGDPIAKNPPHFRMVTDCVRHKRLRQDIGEVIRRELGMDDDVSVEVEEEEEVESVVECENEEELLMVMRALRRNQPGDSLR